MKDTTQPIDDMMLSAYVDGELADGERERVEAHLRDDPEAAARVRLWRADREALRMTLDAQLHDPVPQRLAAIVRDGQPAAPPRPWLKAAMAAGLLLAGGLIGALATWSGMQSTQQARMAQRWTQRAIAAHAVYVPEVRHPVEVSVREGSAEQQRAQEEHLVKWLTKRLGLPVVAFDLSAQGFALVGGRLLPDEPRAGQPGAQLMYQNDAGQRVTVYMRKPEPGNTDVAIRFEQQGEFGMYYWVDGDYGCAITGRMPREQLLALAEAVYKQHEETAERSTVR
jgi:anti-sigma factor RsiW